MATRYTTAFVLPYKLIVSPLSPTNKTKSVKRIVGEASWQHLLQKLSAPELQLVMGSDSTLACYKSFSKKNKLSINVEEIEGADARLLWLGEKRTDRVIYFMHGMYLHSSWFDLELNFYPGGGFNLPLQVFHPAFLKYVQDELANKGFPVGVAILNYSEHTPLFPIYSFHQLVFF